MLKSSDDPCVDCPDVRDLSKWCLVGFCDLEHWYRLCSLAVLRRLVETVGRLLSRHLCAEQVIPICADEMRTVSALAVKN